MTKNYCPARVADHTDHTTCDELTLPGHTYCITHRVERLQELRSRCEASERELARHQQEFEALLAEGKAVQLPLSECPVPSESTPEAP